MKFLDNGRGPYVRDAPSSYNELYHFGTKGMKWGRRRYQNEDGSLTDEGRQHYGYSLKRTIKNIGEARRKKKAAKKRAQALEKARKARAEKRAHEQAKNKAIETGDATEVLKYKNELSTKEKQDIYNRLQADENLARIADNESRRRAEEAARNSKWNKAKNLTSKLSDAGDMLTKAGNTYNSVAKVVNAFSDTKLPMIGEKADDGPSFSETKRYAQAILNEIADKPVKEISEQDYKDFVTRASQISNLEKYAKTGKAGGK